MDQHRKITGKDYQDAMSFSLPVGAVREIKTGITAGLWYHRWGIGPADFTLSLEKPNINQKTEEKKMTPMDEEKKKELTELVQGVVREELSGKVLPKGYTRHPACGCLVKSGTEGKPCPYCTGDQGKDEDDLI